MKHIKNISGQCAGGQRKVGLNMLDRISLPAYIESCPISAHWVDYNGKLKFAMLNFDESIQRGKAMIDICYCATAGLINGRIEKTVPYSKKIFKIVSL